MKNNKKLNEMLQISRLFTQVDMIWGIPRTLFVFGCLIGLVTFLELSKVLGLLFFILYFKLMFSIHEHDPQGFKVWRQTLFQKRSGWKAGHVETLHITHLGG